MVRADLLAMLDTTYELEGLLNLALNREPAPERLEELVALKIKRLSDLLSSEEETLPASPVEESEDSYSLEDEEEEEEEVASYTEDTDDYAVNTGDDAEDTEVNAVAADDDADIPDDSSDNKGNSSAEVEKEQIIVNVEPATKVDLKPREVVAAEPKEKERKSMNVPVFSINDRFFYSRELFGGKVAEFEGALKEVAGMDCYEEAEEYFLTEYRLDPEQAVVQNFLAVIAKYFE